MRSTYDKSARKRAVNLSLNEDLVTQARDVTDNLSGVVESLLADFVYEEKKRRSDEIQAVKEAVATWNAFAEEHGSFADDYSTL